MNHGGNHYTNDQCRCDECRAAHAENVLGARARRWARRERVNGLLIAPGPRNHGGGSTYTNWGCQCQPCRTAHNAARARCYRKGRARRDQSE
jgi:hypothetical protein